MKPKTKEEAHLHRKFQLEDEIPYEIEREARRAKKIWKRQTHKVQRSQGKQQIMKGLEDSET